MAVLTGLTGSIGIGSSKVAETSDWKVDYSADMLESTSFGGDGTKTFLPGLKEWNGSTNSNFDQTDTTGQKAMQDAFLNGTSVALKLYVDATHYYGGTAYIKKISPAVQVNQIVKVAFDFQGSGALMYN
jgi:predicted secreted protein